MKKIIPVLIAVFMIIVIAVIGVGARLMEKYSYSKERADLTEYFEVRGEGDVPVILQDERIEEHARLIDGVCYFDLATVHKYFNDRFFLDTKEGLLLYTLPDAIVSTLIGEQTVSVGTDGSTRDYIIARYEGDVLYVAADFVNQGFQGCRVLIAGKEPLCSALACLLEQEGGFKKVSVIRCEKQVPLSGKGVLLIHKERNRRDGIITNDQGE